MYGQAGPIVSHEWTNTKEISNHQHLSMACFISRETVPLRICSEHSSKENSEEPKPSTSKAVSSQKIVNALTKSCETNHPSALQNIESHMLKDDVTRMELIRC